MPIRTLKDLAAATALLATSALALPAMADVIVNNPVGENLLTSGFTQSEASVLVIGSTVLVAYDDAGSNAGGANKFVGWARSTNGGSSFTDMGSLPTNPGGDAGDPRFARSASTGTVFLTTIGFSVNNTQLFRSTDGGATFNAPVNATPGAGKINDTHSVAVDNFAGAGGGNVYVAARDFGSAPGIYFHKSTDDGLTFDAGILIAAGGSSPQSPIVTVGTDHSINVTYFEGSGGSKIVTRRSTDGGLSFGPPAIVATFAGSGVNGDLGLVGIRQGTAVAAGFRSNGFPQVKVNPLNGHMYVTYADNPAGTDKADVFYRVSTDNGTTWSAAVRINTDATTNDQFNPNIAVTPNGQKVGFFWYDRRNDAGNNFIEYFTRTCDVVGVALICGADFAINDVAFLPEFGRDTIVNSVYMGDQDFAGADNDWFYVAWGDKRNDGFAGRKNPDVYFNRVATGLVDPSPVPAPATALLLAGGLAALGTARRRS